MSFSINTNTTAAYANNYLGTARNAMSASLERISTGNQINSAADNASGLSIADSLRSQAHGMGQAMRNANDGISVSQIADSSLGDVNNILDTIRTKAIQAADAGQSTESRQAIQADIDSSLKAIDQIAGTTSYNGQKLLSGNFTNKQFQTGTNPGETTDLSIDSTQTTNLGDMEKSDGSLADIDVTTAEGARRAMEITDQALEQVGTIRSNIGSSQNQLESQINNLASSQINARASESAIRDTDYAEEAMVLNKMEMLTRAGTFAAKHANISKENAVSLLA
ncbi:MAG TPA: flagellin [Desulfobacteraceae bacterium]|nr:flagellin [Desulfobacteraceae bacterium]